MKYISNERKQKANKYKHSFLKIMPKKIERNKGKMKKTEVKLRLQYIRQRMKEEKIDAWMVFSNDYHESEYVGEYFKCREYISGFTGSAGSVVILQKEAGLWTDGRYFLQAEDELKGSGIELYRSGEYDVMELDDYLLQKLPKHAVVGVDGKTISVNAYRKLKKKLDKKEITIWLDGDLVGDIWHNRPEMSCKPVWELELCYAGMSRNEKLSILRKKLESEGAEWSIISSLDDIAWTLNIRGSDIACTPLVLSFLIIRKNDAIWFVQLKAVDSVLKKKLQDDGIVLKNYEEIDRFLSEESDNSSLYLDPDRTNMYIFTKIQGRKCVKQGSILEGKNITLLPKAVKNQIEIENIRKAHKKDAAACIKFIYWLKKNICNIKGGEINEIKNDKKQDAGECFIDKITELSVAKKLEEFRSEQRNYLGPSFATIAGYAHHSAIIHYSATPDTDIQLKPQSFLLIDSGGQYLEGTTDITRTIALGPLTQEQKHLYTLVLKGNLNLASAKFKYGTPGISLDCLARTPLWNEGLDYNHGTGHGVGYLLSVHEPPNSFRNKLSESGEECIRLEPGMVTSDEPGIYLPGKYGIRLENLLVCIESEKNEFGRFLEFETLTLVPFERDAILVEELTDSERKLLNQYHTRIRKEMKEYLECQEYEWLEKITGEI